MSEPLSVRERLSAIALRLLPGRPEPDEVMALEMSLVGLLWLVEQERIASDVAYKIAIAEAPGESATARKQHADAGKTFARWREAEGVYKTVDQMIKTCRSSIRLQTESVRRG